MARFAPIRDHLGGIVGMQPKEEGCAFAETLRETMAAVGGAEAAPEGEEHAARYRPGRREVAALVGGLVLAVAPCPSSSTSINTLPLAPSLTIKQ
jgi:hypothetical protein